MLPAAGTSAAAPLRCPTVSVLQHEGTYPVMANTVSVLVGSTYRVGFLARPDQAGRFPAVVLIPNHGVLGAHEKSAAWRLSRLGLAVIACNLTGGTAGDPEAAYRGLADEEAIRVLDEVHQWLDSEDISWAISHKVGMLGFDVGGRFALMTAAHRDWVGAAAVVAMPLTGDEERRHPVAGILGHLPVPVLGLYGADDSLVTPAEVDDAQRRNESGNWLLYAGAGHGFSDDGSADYHRDAAEDALVRIADFFLAALPKAEPIVTG